MYNPDFFQSCYLPALCLPLENTSVDIEGYKKYFKKRNWKLKQVPDEVYGLICSTCNYTHACRSDISLNCYRLY